MPLKSVKHRRWERDEHATFLGGLEKHSRDCVKIAKIVITRLRAQIKKRTHKYFSKELKNK